MPEMLSNEEIAQLWKESWQRSNPYAADESTINLFARAVESAVLRKAVEMVREVGATYNALGEQVCSEVADFLKGRWKP